MKIYPGMKFYRYNDSNELEIIRVKNYQNSQILRIFTNNTVEKINVADLITNYTALKPDAILSFSIAKLKNGLRDVIVSLHRQSDIDSSVQTPYVVCRQCITDIFANQFVSEPDKYYYGASVSVETCPANVNFDIMLTCDGVESSELIAVYIDDKLNDMLSLINSHKYDSALLTAYMDFAANKSKDFGNFMYRAIMEADNYAGYCKTLKDLLVSNNFMFDFYKTYNIVPLEFYNMNNYINDRLCEEYVKILSDLTCSNIVDTIVIPYHKDIDLSMINNTGKKYIIISDVNQDLYLIAYKTHGIYHVPVEAVENEENITKIYNIMTKKTNENSSISEAYNKIMFSKNKYDI